MASRDDLGQYLRQTLVGINHDHLCAGDHDVSDLHVANHQRAFHDLSGILVDNLVLFSKRKHTREVRFGLGFTTDKVSESIDPGSFFSLGFSFVVHGWAPSKGSVNS